jgi:hypothetical protein
MLKQLFVTGLLALTLHQNVEAKPIPRGKGSVKQLHQVLESTCRADNVMYKVAFAVQNGDNGVWEDITLRTKGREPTRDAASRDDVKFAKFIDKHVKDAGTVFVYHCNIMESEKALQERVKKGYGMHPSTNIEPKIWASTLRDYYFHQLTPSPQSVQGLVREADMFHLKRPRGYIASRAVTTSLPGIPSRVFQYSVNDSTMELLRLIHEPNFLQHPDTKHLLQNLPPKHATALRMNPREGVASIVSDSYNIMRSTYANRTINLEGSVYQQLRGFLPAAERAGVHLTYFSDK